MPPLDEPAAKVCLSMGEIAERMRAADYPTVDAIVGIQTGGRIPATLLSFHLGLPLYMLPINYRDENNDPRYDQPRVLAEVHKLPPAGRVELSGIKPNPPEGHVMYLWVGLYRPDDKTCGTLLLHESAIVR